MAATKLVDLPRAIRVEFGRLNYEECYVVYLSTQALLARPLGESRPEELIHAVQRAKVIVHPPLFAAVSPDTGEDVEVKPVPPPPDRNLTGGATLGVTEFLDKLSSTAVSALLDIASEHQERLLSVSRRQCCTDPAGLVRSTEQAVARIWPSDSRKAETGRFAVEVVDPRRRHPRKRYPGYRDLEEARLEAVRRCETSSGKADVLWE